MIVDTKISLSTLQIFLLFKWVWENWIPYLFKWNDNKQIWKRKVFEIIELLKIVTIEPGSLKNHLFQWKIWF